jgi:hypothetical protein
MSGGTNNNIKNQNKQIRKQYGYDKEFRTFEHRTNQDRYQEAIAKTEAARANEAANREYRDKTNEQNYEYQSELQSQQYQAEVNAFDKSEEIYGKQLDINTQAALLTTESIRREADEGLIAATFGDIDSDIKQEEFTTSAGLDKEGNQIKRTDAKSMNRIDRKAVSLDRNEKLEQNKVDLTKLNSIYHHDGRKYMIQQAQYDQDKSRIGSNEGWGLETNTLEFQQAAAKNLAARIDNRAELIRTKGAVLARGVQGNTAGALAQSALAEYGRKQAASALDLIFTSQQKSISDRKTSGTAGYDASAVDTKKSISTVERQKAGDVLSLDSAKIKIDSKFAIKKADNKISKLNQALDTTLKQLNLSDRKIDSSVKFQTKRYQVGKSKTEATRKSIRDEYNAANRKLAVDKEAQDLQAYGRKMLEPIKPPPIPKPLKLPQTIFIDPTAPRKPPKPVKGAIGKTSVWNTVSDGLGVVSSVASIAAPFAASDIKTKHTVEPIENASTKLSNLKPVSFYYTPEYTAEPDRLHHGFVAQEYKEVMPDATYDLKGTLAIDTNDLIGLLVKGHQELQEKIVQLEEKLSATN